MVKELSSKKETVVKQCNHGVKKIEKAMKFH